MSPVAPITSGSSTINRTLLHHHHHISQNGAETLPLRNGTSNKRGLAYSGDSPPPDYNIVVHDNSRHGFFIFRFISILIFIIFLFLLNLHSKFYQSISIY